MLNEGRRTAPRMLGDAGQVEQLAREIRSSRKYRDLARETVMDVVRQEASGSDSASRKETERRARERLHRIAAYYLGEPEYAREEAALSRAFAQEEAVRERSVSQVCRRILSSHASSRERLPILEELYRSIFAVTGVPERVADLACACNPCAFRWMGLPRSTCYRAYDINRGMVRLLARYFALEGLAGGAELRDVLCSPPTRHADVALLLKMYHCLEHRRRGAGEAVLMRTRARWVAVSFPSRNLRGRSADIAGNYREDIERVCAREAWECRALVLEGETVLLVRKGQES